ncbi:MBL fold metallo-hydrolase [Cellulosimicrobium cellulans]|uniref:MBL fold metallo-hydrolase n=1 Tax=Cellulosimicrobium cellulans TaxID=1710 RepID=UPI0018843045|nr:MBL fold metallo-hydrolase [Cellulosimicrobium cellulans]MBE9926563.1 MBL fold metallo-hydrolase [Cellulosimicrobium cellulans]
MSVTVTWLGHSSAVLDLAATPGGPTARLVTDPLLHRHAGMLRRRGEQPATVWRGGDAVLLSHLHHDHAELRSLRLLGDVPVLTAPANARWLRGKGLRGVGLGDEWHAVGPPGAGVETRLVTAVHGHRPMPHRPNAANGHLVRTTGPDGLRVWVAGDTEHHPGMVHLPALAGGPVDVALVPVGGWGPRLSGGHLGPVQAARVCAEVGVRVAVPVHWGTLHAPGGQHLPRGWMDHAGAAFEAAAQREAPGTRVVVLRPGGSWSTDDDG